MRDGSGERPKAIKNNLNARPMIDRSNTDDNTRTSALYQRRLLCLPLSTWRSPCGYSRYEQISFVDS